MAVARVLAAMVTGLANISPGPSDPKSGRCSLSTMTARSALGGPCLGPAPVTACAWSSQSPARVLAGTQLDVDGEGGCVKGLADVLHRLVLQGPAHIGDVGVVGQLHPQNQPLAGLGAQTCGRAGDAADAADLILHRVRQCAGMNRGQPVAVVRGQVQPLQAVYPQLSEQPPCTQESEQQARGRDGPPEPGPVGGEAAQLPGQDRTAGRRRAERSQAGRETEAASQRKQQAQKERGRRG